jgi:hypothetical protein
MKGKKLALSPLPFAFFSMCHINYSVAKQQQRLPLSIGLRKYFLFVHISSVTHKKSWKFSLFIRRWVQKKLRLLGILYAILFSSRHFSQRLTSDGCVTGQRNAPGGSPFPFLRLRREIHRDTRRVKKLFSSSVSATRHESIRYGIFCINTKRFSL